MYPSLLIYAISTFSLYSRLASSDSLVEDGSKDNSNQCDCYLTSGPNPGYFTYHRFFDFRNIPNDGENDFTIAPSLVTSAEDGGEEETTSTFFNSNDFQTNWEIEKGISRQDSPVHIVNTARNAYISRNSTPGNEASTYLTLRTSRLLDFMSTVEVESNQRNLLHCSIRARVRFISNGMSNSSAPTADTEPLDNQRGGNSSHSVDPGACFGLFTYFSDTEESDIEILSQDPLDHIRFSNQPDYDASTDESVEGASTDLVMPDGLVWTEWLDYRIDWFEGISRWYLNDELVLNKTTNVPTSPSGLILNLWGDGGQWTGNMSIGGQVTVGIEWIEMAFNISGNVDGPVSDGNRRDKFLRERADEDDVCHIACNMDNVQEVGFPELAFNSTGSGALSLVRQGDVYHIEYLMAMFVGTILVFA